MRNKRSMNNAVCPVLGVDGKNVMSQERRTQEILVFYYDGRVITIHRIIES